MATRSRSITGARFLTIVGLVAGLLTRAGPAFAAGAPTLALAPTSGSPGTEVAADGTGFSPAAAVQITFDSTPVGETNAAADGSFSTAFTVPDSATPIRHRVRATDAASGLQASATFTVSTPWPMLGFGPGRTGNNPFENVLTRERVRGLAVDVLTHDRAASSAAYARGSLLVGMGDGSVRSINVGTGHVRWSFATGGPVRSTPALVFGARIRGAAQDAVVVGSDDGRVYALSAATGKKLWRFQTGGPVRSSPLVLPDLRPAGAPSGLVVVGSNDGHLYTLSLASGLLVLMADMGGQVVSSPVYAVWLTVGAADRQAAEIPFVAVGSTDGTLRAFDAMTGAPMWSRDLGGRVVASPMVLPSSSPSAPGCGGIVAASTAGRVFALACDDGHRLWSVNVGAPVVGSPALLTCPPTPGAPACRDVVIGTTAGRLWLIDTAHPTAADSIWIDLGYPIRTASGVAAGLAWVHTSPTLDAPGAVHAVTLPAMRNLARIELPTEPATAHPPTGISSSPAVADGMVLFPQFKLFLKSDWPRFRHDTTGTGFNGFEWKLGANNVAGLHLLWKGPEAGNTGTRSSPAVADGVAYIGAENGKLSAFPASCSDPCSPLWTGKTDDAIVSTPAVANGVVYVGSRDTDLYAFPTSCSNPCSPLWKGHTGTQLFQPGPVVSSPVVANGVVYVGSLGGSLFAFPASCSNPCTPLWDAPIFGGVASSPVVSGGKVFVGGLDGRVFAFPANCSNPCTASWVAQTGSAVESSPAVANGVVYVGGSNGKLYAFPTGCSNPCSPLWTAQMSIEIAAAPAVAKGVVYVGSRGSVSSKFSAFPANCSNPCSPLWSANIIVSDSAAVANGVVYVGSSDQHLYAFPASCSDPCSPIRTIDTLDSVTSSPAIADGVVYIGYQNRFAAFGP